ncbi:hypothetical protein CAPTEDRAFT_165154 [Capitella teleta]|uniref:Polysaccharide biosynthesis domain-containing protein n=1 Tax=Capitella teleta TaxID=283909 RepID=R7TI68_CAPTE|nr:hypothetical protein CAPTEDRAFT_165154 [Capitella teleta]|eukprot:ELT93419.1 hypothetical protein CAPTEDRAFT_165154 [Capitella teleta]
MNNLSGSQLMDVNTALSLPADQYGNDEALECQWAMKAFQHAETYFNLIKAVDTSVLRLTPIDDAIYIVFREEFPDLKIDVLDLGEMKSTDGKAKWRDLLYKFEGQVNDWNMGTLLRVDCTDEVNEKNTTLVPRIQFLAIEVARNREGFNKIIREKFREAQKPSDS